MMFFLFLKYLYLVFTTDIFAKNLNLLKVIFLNIKNNLFGNLF